MLKIHTQTRIYIFKAGLPAEVVDRLRRGLQSFGPPNWLVDKEVIEADELVPMGELYLVRRAPHGLIGGFDRNAIVMLEEIP